MLVPRFVPLHILQLILNTNVFLKILSLFSPDPIPSLNPFLTKASTAVLAASRFAASTPLILELRISLYVL